MPEGFLNFTVDHMTFLVDPKFYNVSYALFRIILGVGSKDVIYEKRRRWPGTAEEQSMTFASCIGEVPNKGGLNKTIIAVVQPTEPSSQGSHVRDILKNRGGSAHWQHIALRTPDLLAFHRHALERGVNFITPILKDADEDLIQVFSGEWNLPGARPTGIFFEFVQRDPGKNLLKKLAESNRESWFRDKTFMGLYGEKEDEYRRGRVRPFIDEALFKKISALLKGKRQWEITEKDLAEVEETMKDYAEKSLTARP